MLSDLGYDLINISGQHEQQILLKSEEHLEILDDFAGLMDVREEVKNLFQQLEKISRELADLAFQEKRKAEREELLNFELKEIENAGLEPEEDKKLKEERTILKMRESFLNIPRKFTTLFTCEMAQ